MKKKGRLAFMREWFEIVARNCLMTRSEPIVVLTTHVGSAGEPMVDVIINPDLIGERGMIGSFLDVVARTFNHPGTVDDMVLINPDGTLHPGPVKHPVDATVTPGTAAPPDGPVPMVGKVLQLSNCAVHLLLCPRCNRTACLGLSSPDPLTPPDGDAKVWCVCHPCKYAVPLLRKLTAQPEK